MPKCMGAGCQAAATVLTSMEEGMTFWCDRCDPKLLQLERQLSYSNVGGIERSDRLRAATNEARGIVNQ